MFDPRARLIRLIHVAKRDLHLSDEDYQQLLLQVTGKKSCRQMRADELDRVMRRLKASGFQVRQARPAQPPQPPSDDPQTRKIRALWRALHADGLIRNPTDQALNGFVRRMTGIDSVAWLNTDQAIQVIEMLKKWQQRGLRRSRGESHVSA